MPGCQSTNRYEWFDRQRGDKPDVRFGAKADHDKNARRADLGNADNFQPAQDDRIIDVGPPIVRPGRRRTSQWQERVGVRPTRVFSTEFKVRGTRPAIPAARKSWSPRHREVIGVA
jgi:hypothetical protein